MVASFLLSFLPSLLSSFIFLKDSSPNSPFEVAGVVGTGGLQTDRSTALAAQHSHELRG